MNRGLQGVSNPPSPLVNRGATNPDIPANDRFSCGLQVRQTATRTPHGSGDSGRIQTHARRTGLGNETQTFRRWFSVLLALAVLVHPVAARAHVHGCHTRKCDRRVHAARLVQMVERKIALVTSFRCYGQPSAVPCWIITRESRGSWTAWNPQAVHGYHARGFYQLLGHGEPWPVLGGSRYETLKRKLAHHRIAHELWRQQQAGQARAW